MSKARVRYMFTKSRSRQFVGVYYVFRKKVGSRDPIVLARVHGDEDPEALIGILNETGELPPFKPAHRKGTPGKPNPRKKRARKPTT